MSDNRRASIAAEARRRAQAWTDPDETGSVTPVNRRPSTSDVSRNAGAFVDERGGPIHVGASADIVSRRQNTAPVGNRYQPSAAQGVEGTAAGSPAGRATRAPAEDSPYVCPACRNYFQGPTDNAKPPQLPVLLVPCGHTVCRTCVVQWTRERNEKSHEPTCPLCQRPFSGTSVNQAVVAMMPSVARREADPSASSADAVAHASAAGASAIAPLPPPLRRALHEQATDDLRATRAEENARVALAHARLALLRRDEARLAQAEVEDADATSRSQQAVEAALTGELQGIEAEIKRLELERTVVLSQLGDVIQNRARCGVRAFEATRRREALHSLTAVHRTTADQYRNATLDMVPGTAVASQLDDAMHHAARSGGVSPTQ
jgi:hypothetical protein